MVVKYLLVEELAEFSSIPTLPP